VFAVSVRIITGILKGREVFLPKGSRFRPSTHYLREMLFSIIGPEEIIDAVFLDVFAGTGVVGMEAISRGARKAVFLEKSHKCVESIRSNLARFEVEDRGMVLKMDATRDLPAVGRALGDHEVVDLVFIDPPFSTPLEVPLLAAAVRNRNLFAPDCRFFLETRFRPEDIPDELTVADQRKTSSSVLTTLTFG
jgi:16S rRNA (guanine(966)-N(2))-methyltransferase RsmD